MGDIILRLEGIAKSFGGVRALIDGALTLEAGTVTALIGENGAGKSTLVKILTGVHRPDGGRIELYGQPVEMTSPRDAEALGIRVIHQESVVFEDLSVAENILPTRRPRRIGLIDWRRMRSDAAELLAELECHIDPRTPLRELAIGERHVVQIARALAGDARIVIMDEPTAALSHHEAEDLLKIVRRLKSKGRSILYISHKFEEILSIADRYVVFRDGAAVGNGALTDTNLDTLVSLMVGRPIGEVFPKRPATRGAEALAVRHLSRARLFEDVSFEVHHGEILGVYGLVGAGRSDVMQCLFGLDQADAGQIVIGGNEVHFRQAADAIRCGIGFVPEDRQAQGAIQSLSVRANIALPSLDRLSPGLFSDTRAETRTATHWIQDLRIKCDNPDQPVSLLSGGNQQKVVLARWLEGKPQILILDEPTKGIDVGSKAAVHELVGEAVLVMRRGRVRGVFSREAATAELILRAATDS